MSKLEGTKLCKTTLEAVETCRRREIHKHICDILNLKTCGLTLQCLFCRLEHFEVFWVLKCQDRFNSSSKKFQNDVPGRFK